LGTFAENNVEILTPWNWDRGQWETVHLFTQYTGKIAVRSTNSSNNLTVSAYSSINDAKDTLSIALVNRDVNNSQAVKITPKNAKYSDGKVNCYQLSNLPATETFKSSTDNALVSSEIDITGGSIAMSLPKLSVTVVRIPLGVISGIKQVENEKFRIYPNPAKQQVTIETSGLNGETKITISDMSGKLIQTYQLKNSAQTKVSIDISSFEKGSYIVNLYSDNKKYSQKLIVE